MRHRVNKGVFHDHNTGIRKARGVYVIFVDGDDDWLPEKLERQLARLGTTTPEVAVSITGYYLVQDHLGRRKARPLPDQAD